jgi:hypothetical protein
LLVDPRVIQVVREVREGGHQQVVFHLRAGDRLDDGSEPVEDRLGIEACRAVRHPGDRVDVENDAVDGLQVADEGRVDPCLLGQLQFIVVFPGPDRQGDCGQHDRR